MTYMYAFYMLLHCLFSVLDYKSYFQFFTTHRIPKNINAFHRYFVSGPFKAIFFIDLHKLLLWRSAHKCNWGKGEKITHHVYLNSLGENNSPPAKILLQKVDLSCSSEKKKENPLICKKWGYRNVRKIKLCRMDEGESRGWQELQKKCGC